MILIPLGVCARIWLIMSEVYSGSGDSEVLTRTGWETLEAAGLGVDSMSWDALAHLAPAAGETSIPSVESKERSGGRYRRRATEVVTDLSEVEASAEKKLLPREEVICDRDHIEGQRIDVVRNKDREVWEFSFKLTADAYRHAVGLLSQRQSENPDSVGAGRINWNVPGLNIDAYAFAVGDLQVAIADPKSAERNRAGLGFVQIIAPYDMSGEQLSDGLRGALDELAVQDGLERPSEEAERQYKNNVYAWHYKKKKDEPDMLDTDISESLERRDVAEGYSALVQPGKYEDLASQYGDVRAVHHLSTGSTDSIYRVLTQGLTATTERYKRGFSLKTGMSPLEDIRTGGADNVFVRTVRPEQLTDTASSHDYTSGTTIVFRPELYDRMDWYAYDGDRYGRTDEFTFSQRLTPDELFRRANDNSLYPGNEQMFRTGIGPDFVEYVYVAYDAEGVIAELKTRGLEEINGRKIEDIVKLRDEARAEELRLEAEKKALEIKAIHEAIEQGDMSWAADFNDLTEKLGVNTVEDFAGAAALILEHGGAEGLKELLLGEIDSNWSSIEPELTALINDTPNEKSDEDTQALLKWAETNLGVDWAQVMQEQEEKGGADA